MTPKVSFVVAVHGVEPYIAQCAQSIFEQTMADIEIVFVDDASPDKSVEIIEQLLEQYPNRKRQVKIVRHPSNLGAPMARQNGVKAASGEYLFLMDGDDYVDVGFAERSYQYAIEQGADLVLLDCYNDIDGEITRTETCWCADKTDSAQLRLGTLNRMCVPCLWCRLFRKDLFSHDFAWPKFHMMDDVTLTFALTLVSKQMVYLPEAFYYYRFSPTSICHAAGEEKDLLRFEQSCANTDIILQNIRLYNMESACERGIVFTKMCAKNYLLMHTNKLKYRRMWFRTYPETVSLMWHGNDTIQTTWKERVWLVVIWLGLFPGLKWLMLNRRFRVNYVWRGDLFRK